MRMAFIHYGLGNLFFDQMGDQDWMPRGIRREFLDRYVIYDGRFISVELITALLEDYSRPRLMTEQERAGFLQEYFYYSGWIPFNATPTPTITPTLTPMSIPPLAEASNLLPSNTPTPSAVSFALQSRCFRRCRQLDLLSVKGVCHDHLRHFPHDLTKSSHLAR